MAQAPRKTGTHDQVYTVSRLNREVRLLLEGSLPLMWIEGELSNVTRPASGHLYFTLKDETAQVRGAMFRQRNMHLNFEPENGMHVLVRARVALYEPRGDYQLVVEHLEEVGSGALQRAFEALKQRLALEGLFDSAGKKPLPALPRRIGIVTSPTGAAVRDVLSVLKRRFPAIPVLIYPVTVQGEGAAPDIVRTLRLAGQRHDCDVLILTRGGGSLEDLWAFNEETVARAIHQCPIPIVCGIGHEVDFTIADFVADQRAPTPSVAAELVTPDREELRRKVATLQARLARRTGQALARYRQILDGTARRLQHPGQRLRAQSQRLDDIEQRLFMAQRARQGRLTGRVATLTAQVERHTPLHLLRRLKQHTQGLALRLRQAMHRQHRDRRHALGGLMRALDTVSPLATLERGYAIVRRPAGGEVIREAAHMTRGDSIEALLAHGRLHCRVESVETTPIADVGTLHAPEP